MSKMSNKEAVSYIESERARMINAGYLKNENLIPPKDMLAKRRISNAVAAVITNASMTQDNRDKAWVDIGNQIQAKGEKFAEWVRRIVKNTGMTTFTIIDGKNYKLSMMAQAKGLGYNMEPRKSEKTGKTVKSEGEKYADNRLMSLRRELRLSDVKVESDPRGGANNKTGKNGSTSQEKADQPEIFSAIALLKGYKADLPETDQTLFMHCLARIETIEKKKRSQ